MTINKSQAQTLDIAGLYLPKPAFTHGQLYVPLSRVTSRRGLKILIQNENGIAKNGKKKLFIEKFSISCIQVRLLLFFLICIIVVLPMFLFSILSVWLSTHRLLLHCCCSNYSSFSVAFILLSAYLFIYYAKWLSVYASSYLCLFLICTVTTLLYLWLFMNKPCCHDRKPRDMNHQFLSELPNYKENQVIMIRIARIWDSINLKTGSLISLDFLATDALCIIYIVW